MTRGGLVKNIDFLREAGARSDFMDTSDFLDIIDQIMAEVSHLEAGAAMLVKKLEVERLCGMQHTDEVNGWLETEKGPGPGT